MIPKQELLGDLLPLNQPLQREFYAENCRVEGRASSLHCINEIVLRNFGLAQDPRESSDFDLAMHWHHATLWPAPHDDVATGLANLCETQVLKCFDDRGPRSARQLRHSPEG